MINLTEKQVETLSIEMVKPFQFRSVCKEKQEYYIEPLKKAKLPDIDWSSKHHYLLSVMHALQKGVSTFGFRYNLVSDDGTVIEENKLFTIITDKNM